MADVLRGGGVQCNEKCGCPGGLACKSVQILRAQAKRRASMTTRSALVGNIAAATPAPVSRLNPLEHTSPSVGSTCTA
ncbi:hypothetical protein WN943_023963 [Citrus x changshan-huyou]